MKEHKTAPLSLPVTRLRERYDVVVVGSGYGGAIAASRLARAGRSVCVLERGRELRPGDYPDTAWQAFRQLQVRTARRRLGRRSALFELHADHEVSVVVGCGLGGTSLINAGVALRPPAWVYDDERWPAELQTCGDEVLAPYFERAERMLGSTPLPDSWPEPAKLAALRTAAEGLGADVERPAINVTFQAGPNAAGVHQEACILCGDCVAGCNHNAKNTVLVNYLPDAVAHGAEIFCETPVRTVRPADAGRGWVVTFETPGGGARPGSPASFVFAEVVVLAAGTLGSTEILARSRTEGLAVSPRLGSRFSGNGDVLGFAYDAEVPVRGIGSGRRRPGSTETATGPTVTGMVDLTADRSRSLLVEEGAIPGALRALMPAALALGAETGGGGGPLAFARRLGRRLRRHPRRVLARRGGAADDTLTYLVMSDDTGDGELRLEGSGVRVHWTGAGDRPVFDRNADALGKASASLGATFVPNPLSTPMFHDSLVTVHPLGGCPMGDDGATGVVDHAGRVFTGSDGEVHDGLLVMDGAVVPRPLAVNPLLTISALAERACDLLAAARGWAGAGSTPPDPGPSTPAIPRPGITFTERMAGWAAPSADGDPVAGERRGRADGTPLEFVLTVVIDDLEALLDDPATPGRLAGTVTAPVLSPQRLRVADGTFRLLQEDPTHVDTWHMRYSMRLVAEDGREFAFEGTKYLHDRSGFDAWSDTTTLHVTITGGADHPGVGVAGVVRLGPADFARQLTTMRITGVDGALEQARWLTRFSAQFLRGLATVYDGPLDGVGDFPAAPAAPVPPTGDGTRPLRLPAAEPRWCDAAGRWHDGNDLGDDAWLRLTRYEGGRRGPVLLAPGFGMSAMSFIGGTTDTNLTEHLVAKGYDVWLFDYRAGIDLASARTSFTFDDIATQDWPAAVAEVLRVTGASSVQAVGHCFGSASLMMALAAGLADVRSAVCMQVTLHPVTSLLNQAKAALGVGPLLGRLGLRWVAPFTGGSVALKLLDVGLRAVPMPAGERCSKPVCRWINAIYGCTHTHDQLNDATHDRLDDMFGVGNLRALEHCARIVQARRAVTADGTDVYLSHPERLRLPILLVQGERNYIFHPEGSLRTLRWLQGANDPSLYERVVLPGYAHLDALIGRDAHRDVFPVVSAHLDRFNR
ncbi:MAG TPA: GMC family oxidoreductase N-terminal domain-containing protein [Acidimicrobiales bacterium]|jgi:cholesterol oxidase|nr:GMC family oxidoreductase N-terminal domain-containing protein [Acidimicrobiales bacterium]